MYEWYYSHTQKELYQYTDGVFEAHAAYTPQEALQPTHPVQFWTHHHLKVLPDDAVRAVVTVTVGADHIQLTACYRYSGVWDEKTDQKEIERLILMRNKRHLQQYDIEEGRIHNPIMQKVIKGYGTNDIIKAIRDGTLGLTEATDEAIQAWLSALKQTGSQMTLPRITGAISVEEFQSAFKAVSEKTTSSPSGLHYSIGKCLPATTTLLAGSASS